MTAAGTAETRGFDGSRVTFESLVGLLEGDEAGGLSHSELEDRLEVEGRELLRQLFQDHLDLRADREQRADRERVIDADGVARETVETGAAGDWPACSVRCGSGAWPIGRAGRVICTRPTPC